MNKMKNTMNGFETAKLPKLTVTNSPRSSFNISKVTNPSFNGLPDIKSPKAMQSLVIQKTDSLSEIDLFPLKRASSDNLG